jgi:REP element-mobilizing transposase RayT
MPRKPRQEVEPGVTHVFARGNDRQLIFFDDRDRLRYLAELASIVPALGWRCLTYCLMANHVHLLIETTRPNLAVGMRLLHGRHAQAINKRHRRSGHLFGDRYGSVRVGDDAHLSTAVRYVVRNPVEAGLCSDPAEWRWGAHAAVARGHSEPWVAHWRLGELLSVWGPDPAAAYRACVDAG